MRLAVCTLSAVLLSGCSWLGIGGNSSGYSNYQMGGSSAYGCGANYAGGGHGVNPHAGGQNAYGQNSYGYGQSQPGCGAAGAYGVAGNGYQGAAGYGANGYGAGANGFGAGAGGYGGMGANGYGHSAAGFGAGTNGYSSGRYGAGAGNYNAGGRGAGFGANGLRGAQGFGGYGATGAGTVLNGAAPYGAAVGGGTQFANSGQYVNGQWATGGASTVQTIQGAPIYVPQPYPAYYGVGYNAGYAGGYSGGSQYWRGASAAMPFGIEAGVGTDFGIGGNIVDAKTAGVATGGTLNVSATPAISYADAYKKAVSYDMAATYDISPSTTILGRIGYSEAEGNLIRTGTIDNGALTEDLFAQWGDLEQITLEGGVRQYLGGWNNGVSGLRPYVGATGGFTHNNDVSLSQSSATLMPVGSNVQPYLNSGWAPTASGVIGAEMQVGARTAIGVESGIRWQDDIGSNVLQQEDRWSVPLKLRGRVSF